MSTTPTPLPSLSDAIAAVQASQATYKAAVAQTTTDQATQTSNAQAAATQAATDAAAVSADITAQDSAATQFDSDLQTLIAVAQAAAVPTS
jgi:hypothetical protein